MSIGLDPTKPMEPEEVVQILRIIRGHVPDFAQLAGAERLALGRVAALDPEFVQASINAVGASTPLEGALGRSAAELRQDAEFTGRWSAVADELRALLAGVISAIQVRRHRLGLTALQVYGISRQLVRRKENANLLPHIAVMRQRSEFNRRRQPDEGTGGATKPQPKPEPDPQSKPQ